ncbi:hypothetical protein SAMN02745111_02154 [Eubacterium uniforme]|uniref:Uncharacterized protein n=1 Tax=Eubacterium uniforme TaxID=39495 RepID=A0A1T4W1F5_9FIRM|nr:hypothetical protein [Eubacterium uniforme]SKA71073.1 hypothetical protein SAMN02745111_02154 [Eubacterium uniforme]
MRLKSINIFSDYLGDENKTKSCTKILRNDSDFLDYVFSVKTKYINNSYLRQLNICCSPFVKEICVRHCFTEGYPEIVIPFDYSKYSDMSEDERDKYWIDTIEKVFTYLGPRMNCQDDKLKEYISYLYESDIKIYKQTVNEAYKKWRSYERE